MRSPLLYPFVVLFDRKPLVFEQVQRCLGAPYIGSPGQTAPPWHCSLSMLKVELMYSMNVLKFPSLCYNALNRQWVSTTWVSEPLLLVVINLQSWCVYCHEQVMDISTYCVSKSNGPFTSLPLAATLPPSPPPPPILSLLVFSFSWSLPIPLLLFCVFLSEWRSSADPLLCLLWGPKRWGKDFSE